MDYDYSKRGCLLPEGCKDLIDVSKQKATITEHGFIVTARLPELRSRDIEITVEGRSLRIVGKLSNSQVPFESVIEVPPGYGLADAQATCIKGKLRIVVPKCRAAA
ncbi:MAG: Hsp20/alpha crystallin family protein [Verrucomicrobiota bacterium]|jgi:HSP20 family molecular chaperone IbpA